VENEWNEIQISHEHIQIQGRKKGRKGKRDRKLQSATNLEFIGESEALFLMLARRDGPPPLEFA